LFFPALEVLAAADEDEGLLEGRIVLRGARGLERFEEERGVGKVGARLAAGIPRAAVVIAVRLLAPDHLVPLVRLQVLGGVADHRLVLVRLVRGLQSHDVDAGHVIHLDRVIVAGDVPLLGINQGLDEPDSFGHRLVFGVRARANQAGDDDAGDAAVLWLRAPASILVLRASEVVRRFGNGELPRIDGRPSSGRRGDRDQKCCDEGSRNDQSHGMKPQIEQM
jgi:hypothetical protein